MQQIMPEDIIKDKHSLSKACEQLSMYPPDHLTQLKQHTTNSHNFRCRQFCNLSQHQESGAYPEVNIMPPLLRIYLAVR